MCSRLTVKSKSSGSSHTHAHIRVHANTQTQDTTHTLSDGTSLCSRTRARTHKICSPLYTRTMTASGAVDDLPVLMGGVGRGRSRVRALAYTVHTHARRDRARAPRRHCIMGRSYACTSSP